MKLVIFLFVAMVMLSPTAQADTLRCLSMAPPAVEVRIVEEPVTFSRESAEFQVNGRRSDGALRAGITVAERAVFTAGQGHSSAYGCLWLKRIEVTLTLKKPVIKMSDRLNGDVCRYGAVFAHEMTHWNQDRMLIDRYAQRMRDALVFSFSQREDYTFGPASSLAREEGGRTIRATVSSVVATLFKRLQAEREDMQHEVDAVAPGC